jgi:hypothetical protein
MLTFSKITICDIRYSKDANCDLRCNVLSSKVNAKAGGRKNCLPVFAWCYCHAGITQRIRLERATHNTISVLQADHIPAAISGDEEGLSMLSLEGE